MRQAQNSPEKAPSRMPVLRIEPEKRLCPAFDPVTIATFPVAEPDEMGFRVLDNFCEEHIQWNLRARLKPLASGGLSLLPGTSVCHGAEDVVH